MALPNCACVLAVSLLLASAAAQGRTWIVDAANGPGTNFTDLPPAEAAAADGDVLRVRPGTYTRMVTSKGIAVLGEPGFAVRPDPLFGAAVEVTRLPAGRRFTLRGMTAYTDTLPLVMVLSAFQATACRGAVHVQQLHASAPYPLFAAIAVSQCDLVTFTDCSPGIPVSLQASGGVTSIVRCLLRGPPAFSERNTNRFSAPALNANAGARVFVTESTLFGGDGAPIWPFGQTYHPSAPAVLSNAGWLTIGGAPNAVSAGGRVPTTMPRSAIEGTGTVEVDPTATLTPFGGAPPIAAGLTALVAPVAGLAATGGVLGTTMDVVFRSQPNDPYVLGAGLAATPVVTPLGPLCLDLNAWFVLAAGTQAATGATSWSVPLPGDPALAGLGLTLQAASAGGRPHLTNPATVVLQ